MDLVYTARPSCQIRWTSPVRIYIHHLHESIRHALSSSGLFQTIEVLCAAASCCRFHHVRLRVLVLALSFSAHLFLFPFTCPSLCLSPSLSLSLSLFVSVPPSVHPTSLDSSLLFCLPPVLLLSFLLSLLHACSATPIHSSTARSSCPCAVLSLTYLARPGTLFVSLRRGSAAEFVPPPVSMCGLYIFLQVARIWKTLRMHEELSNISYFVFGPLCPSGPVDTRPPLAGWSDKDESLWACAFPCIPVYCVVALRLFCVLRWYQYVARSAQYFCALRCSTFLSSYNGLH